MKKGILIISAIVLFFFNACTHKTSSDQDDIATDSAAIAIGQTIFTQDCNACHNFMQDGIGPQLGGITAAVSADWIRNFIKDPRSLIDAGDERAAQLYKKYKTIMPSFAHYPDDKVNELIAFLNIQKAPVQGKELEDPNALKNPIPDSIQMSDMVVGVEFVTQIPFSSEENPRTRIAKLDFQPNTDKLFMLDLRGILYDLHNNKARVYLDIAKKKPLFINKPGLATGFGSFAFHPEFAKNGLLYTTHTESPGSGKADFGYPDSISVTLQWVLSEWKTKQPGAFPFEGESRELFRINMVTGIHGVQEITFNPLAKPGDEDYGLLYVGVGDGGSVENNYPFLVHSKEKMWGSIIRIDPLGTNSTNGKYGIPANNPFAKSDNPNTARELYAYGFRNPHRITWSKSGQILASNIGHGHIEGFNIILPGHDYGWPIREGTFVHNMYGSMNNIYPLQADDAKYDITYPVAQYDHDEGKAISGGFEYWGKSVPQLSGKYLFGDIANGRLFYVEMADLKVGSQATIKEWKISFHGKPTTLAELCGNERADLRLGRDHQGELYVFTKIDGKVYKLVSANHNL